MRETDKTQIQAVLDAGVAAWNAHDIDALLELQWDDMVAINYVGMLASSRRASLSGLRQIHSTFYSESVLSASTELMWEVAPHVVLVVQRNDLTGDARDPGTTFRQRSMTVLVERDGEWRQAAFQNTRLRDDVA